MLSANGQVNGVVAPIYHRYRVAIVQLEVRDRSVDVGHRCEWSSGKWCCKMGQVLLQSILRYTVHVLRRYTSLEFINNDEERRRVMPLWGETLAGVDDVRRRGSRVVGMSKLFLYRAGSLHPCLSYRCASSTRKVSVRWLAPMVEERDLRLGPACTAGASAVMMRVESASVASASKSFDI